MHKVKLHEEEISHDNLSNDERSTSIVYFKNATPKNQRGGSTCLFSWNWTTKFKNGSPTLTANMEFPRNIKNRNDKFMDFFARIPITPYISRYIRHFQHILSPIMLGLNLVHVLDRALYVLECKLQLVGRFSLYSVYSITSSSFDISCWN